MCSWCGCLVWWCSGRSWHLVCHPTLCSSSSKTTLPTQISRNYDVYTKHVVNALLFAARAVAAETTGQLKDKEIPLPNMRSSVVAKVVEFCQHNRTDPMKKIPQVSVAFLCLSGIWRLQAFDILKPPGTASFTQLDMVHSLVVLYLRGIFLSTRICFHRWTFLVDGERPNGPLPTSRPM